MIFAWHDGCKASPANRKAGKKTSASGNEVRIQMSKYLLVLSLIAGTVFGIAPSSADAQTCVSNMFSGMTGNQRREIIVSATRANGSYASFSIGTLRPVSSTVLEAQVLTTASHQCPEGSCNPDEQRFDIDQAIQQTYRFFSNGRIDILDAAGNIVLSGTASCQGNLLTFFDSVRLTVIGWGARYTAIL